MRTAIAVRRLIELLTTRWQESGHAMGVWPAETLVALQDTVLIGDGVNHANYSS